MFENVRPSWEDRPRPQSVSLDLKAFGQMVQARPTIGNNQKNQITTDGASLPGWVLSCIIVYLLKELFMHKGQNETKPQNFNLI